MIASEPRLTLTSVYNEIASCPINSTEVVDIQRLWFSGAHLKTELTNYYR